MSAPKLKILISGAGIAGPCLAYWLARTRLNASITILERSPKPRLTGQSIDIHGSAVEIVKKMRLEEAVRSRHTTEVGTSILNSSGRIIAHFKAGDTFTAQYEILRADLSGLFLEATEGLGPVNYKYGDYIESLDQTEKNVHVTFSGGTTETFDLLVAADGSTSRTRSLILDEPTLHNTYNFLGQYIAFFSIPRQPHDPKTWQIYNTAPGLCIMLRPHRTTSTTGVYLCITKPAHGIHDPIIEEALSQGPSAQKAVLHTYFQNAGWQAERILSALPTCKDFYMSRSAQVKLPKWTNNRCVLIGDAAFATFGVGTTLAIGSAYTLAGELSKISCSDDIPQALETYERVFRKAYVKMEDLPKWFPQVAFPQTAWAIKGMRALAWMAGKTGVHKLVAGEDEGTKWELADYEWVD